MERYQPDQYGRMMPDAHGQWVSLRAAELTALDAAQKSSADAQATIAALQARVKELEEITKVICGHCCEPMEIPSKAVLQSALTQRTAERDCARRRVDELEAREVDVVLSAELEAARKWKIELCNLTPGGSEFADDPAYCAEWVRKVRENQHDIILNKCREAKSLKAELERVRGLIKALPKVEGEIEVSSGVYNFILLKHDSGTGFLCGQIETEQTARAIAALWKHRQGME